MFEFEILYLLTILTDTIGTIGNNQALVISQYRHLPILQFYYNIQLYMVYQYNIINN